MPVRRDFGARDRLDRRRAAAVRAAGAAGLVRHEGMLGPRLGAARSPAGSVHVTQLRIVVPPSGSPSVTRFTQRAWSRERGLRFGLPYHALANC